MHWILPAIFQGIRSFCSMLKFCSPDYITVLLFITMKQFHAKNPSSSSGISALMMYVDRDHGFSNVNEKHEQEAEIYECEL